MRTVRTLSKSAAARGCPTAPPVPPAIMTSARFWRKISPKCSRIDFNAEFLMLVNKIMIMLGAVSGFVGYGVISF